MSILAQIHARAAQQAAVSVDMNEAEKGGGGGKLLPAGQAFGRIVEYIDLGMQPQTFEGKAVEPREEFRLGIALFGPGFANDDGTPYIFYPRALQLKRNDKSNTFKAFKAMNWQQDPSITHFAQFLGKGFLFKIDRKTSAQTKREYNVVDWAATLAGAPDPVTQQFVSYDQILPAVDEALYRAFFWDFPTIEDWDALHIEGQRDDGSSKNWLQDTILSALNFDGSPLHQLLVQHSRPIAPSRAPAQAAQTPAVPLAVPNATPAAQTPPVAAAAAPVVPSVPAVPATPEVPAVPQVAAPLAQPAAATPSLPQVPQVPTLPNIPAAPTAA